MKQITEDYVSYEIAQLLKEKGFDIPINTFYNSSEEFQHHSCHSLINANYYEYGDNGSAPSQSLALKWLREVHGIDIEVYVYSKDFNGNLSYAANIRKYGSMMMTDDSFIRNTYEESVEAACLWVLKNLL